MPLFEQKEVDLAFFTLWNFLCERDVPKKSDALFVFGCAQISVPRLAAKLFHQNIAPVILVSGAMGKTASTIFGVSECDMFFQELVKEGVPSNAVILERNATNTGENIMFGMKMLRDRGIDPKSVLCVSQPYHARRCKATFQKREPDVTINVCSPEGDVLDFLLFTKERMALRLVGETERLIRYPKLGLMNEVSIPISVLEAVALLRSVLDPDGLFRS
jgi:uncharacterized SAM-binding protein YcdF (DUF218 family)